MSKILKNQTGSPISIADAGVTLPASPATYTIPAQDYLLWSASDNIKTQINSGDVKVNDGTSDLAILDAIDYIENIIPSLVRKSRSDRIVWQPLMVSTTLNGTLNLFESDRTRIILTGSSSGFSIVLPEATTLFDGRTFEISNTTGQIILVKTFGGSTLFTISQTSSSSVILQSNLTSPGTWIFWQTIISDISGGIINYHETSSTPFVTTSVVDVSVPGMSVTPQNGTYAIWYSGQSFTNKNNAQYDCSIYRDSIQIIDTKRTFLGVSSTYIAISGTIGTVQFNGSQLCEVKVAAPDGGTLTVNDRTLLLIRLGL